MSRDSARRTTKQGGAGNDNDGKQKQRSEKEKDGGWNGRDRSPYQGLVLPLSHGVDHRRGTGKGRENKHEREGRDIDPARQTAQRRAHRIADQVCPGHRDK